MAKTRDLDQIQLHQDPWKPVHPRRKDWPVAGLDTETHKGYAFLLTVDTAAGGKEAYPIQRFRDFTYVAWQPRFRESVNFFYNSDFDFMGLAKHLGEEKLTDLAVVNRTMIDTQFELRWIPNKAFALIKASHVRDNVYEADAPKVDAVWFYDLAQFYNRTPLKKLAEKFGERKHDMEFGPDGADRPKWERDARFRATLESYAMQDARICRLAGEHLHQNVNRVIPVHQYFSTATIAQRSFLSQLQVPVGLAPKDIMQMALTSYGGGRFELTMRGGFPKCWEIDINSAYPGEFERLPAIGRHGRWKYVQARTAQGTMEEDTEAHFGFYLIRTHTHGHVLSPIMHRTKDTILYPHGTHTAWVEKSELALVRSMGYKVQILKGAEYFDPAPQYPFGFIRSMYEERQRLKDAGQDDLAYVYKIILNSAYGKTIQLVPLLEILADLPAGFDEANVVREIHRRGGTVLQVVRTGWKAGKMFNPVYAASITARVRSRLVDTVIRHRLEDHLIGFATDCLYLDRAPPQAVVGKGLGAWKLEAGPCPGIFIGSGVYALATHGWTRPKDTAEKDWKKPINHFRGFKTKHDLFESLTKGITSFALERPVKLKEGVRGGVRNTGTEEIPTSWQDIGRFLPQVKTLDLNFDRKRQWDRPFTGPRDVIDGSMHSIPVTV